jgi:predicted HNH restriction endonuclease
MVRFFSQFSFLHWDGTRLHFDSHSISPGFLHELYGFFQPLKTQRMENRELELLELGRIEGRAIRTLPASLELPLIEDDLQFLEGRKIRVTHLVTERNPRLRVAFLEHRSRQQNPILCDMCTLDLKWRYPWTVTMLEIHHLLPLSSPAEVRASGTSLDDLVAICPNCHRGVHSYYRAWLHEKEKLDFDSRKEARDVYDDAKSKIKIGAAT